MLHVNAFQAFDGDPATSWTQVVHGAPVLAIERRAVPVELQWGTDDPTPLVLLSFSTVPEQRSPEMLQRARDTMPRRLNAGILMGDGGFCVLGWMLVSAGFHPITLYANTLGVVDPAVGGPAIDVVARVYDQPRDEVVALARINDTTSRSDRSAAVRSKLDDLLASG